MKVNIITGEKHSGKTTYLINLIEKLRNTKQIGGVLSRGTIVNNSRHSFYIKDITTNNEQLLMSVEPIVNTDKIGRFYVSNNAFIWGKQVMRTAINSESEIIVLDEIGKFELENKGWADIIMPLLNSNKELFFVIRKEFVERIIEKFNIKNYSIIDC